MYWFFLSFALGIHKLLELRMTLTEKEKDLFLCKFEWEKPNLADYVKPQKSMMEIRNNFKNKNSMTYIYSYYIYVNILYIY